MFDSIETDRRAALALAAGAVPAAIAVSGCMVGMTGTGDAGGNAPMEFSPEPPQFFQAAADGRPDELVEIGFSLHCGGTRDWFRENGIGLADDISGGRTAAFLSHLVRSENEIPVGVEMMRVGGERYPEAALACVGLSVRLDRAVGASEVRRFLASLGLRRTTPFRERDAEARLLAVAKVYQEGLGVRGTPFVRQSRIPEEGGAA